MGVSQQLQAFIVGKMTHSLQLNDTELVVLFKNPTGVINMFKLMGRVHVAPSGSVGARAS